MADVYKIDEVCKLLRCGRDAVDSAVRRGELRPIRIGKKIIRFRKPEIDAILNPEEAKESGPTPAA